MSGQALVLGGGGVAGIAWTTGLLAGLAEHGQDLTGADVVVGTSAGSAVGAQIGSGLPLGDLLARQTDPALQATEIPAEIDFEAFAAELADMPGSSPAELRKWFCELALRSETVSEEARRAAVASRLPSPEWPEHQRLLIVAVDAETGEPRVFDRESGVTLLDAVTASCAVPGVWPPAAVDGRRYVEGGIRSGENADYAAGASHATIIAPMGLESPFPVEKPLKDVVAELRAGGTRVAVVVPDEASLAAIGTNPLDPGTRGPAAEAGRAQGAALTIGWE